MCGRTTLSAPAEAVAQTFELEQLPDLEPRYNIAPTQPIPIVRADGAGARHLDHVVWGIIQASAARAINARIETISTRHAFAQSFRARRCLVVADGFYEWQRQARGKRPHHIRRKDEQLLAFAGIWERPAEGMEACAIVTRDALPPVTELHDRMPVILHGEDHRAWLDPATPVDALFAIMRRPPPELTLLPVSSFVNSAAHEGPDCLRAEGGTALSLF